MASTSVILEFLDDWKTREQINKEFSMSNTESYNFLKWAVSGKYIERCSVNIDPHKTNRTILYKALV